MTEKDIHHNPLDVATKHGAASMQDILTCSNSYLKIWQKLILD